MAPSRTLPGEGAHAGRYGWVGALLGALGTVLFWVAVPGAVRSVPITVVGIVGCFAVAIVFASIHWEGRPQPLLLAPVLAGIVGTVVAVANTGGSDSIFGIFFGYCGLGAGYFATRRQLPWLLALMSLAALSPLVYDRGEPFAQELFNSLLWVALGVATAILVFYARERQRGAQEQLETLALQDPLTNVGNRRAFEHAVRGEIARSRRAGTSFTVVYLDLDGFKAVNDQLGHAAGDRILRRVAAGIEASLRGEDVVARYGGDEFAILLPGANEEDALTASHRVIAAIERIAPEDEPARALSASVGMAAFPRDGVDLDTLMEFADRALRRVKTGRASGRTVGAPVGSTLAALAQPFDPSTLLPAGARAGERAAPEPWRLGRVALAALGASGVAAALWFALPLILPTTTARWVTLILAAVALCTLAVTARRATTGRERLGWTLLGFGALVALVPLAGAWAGIVMVFALLLITGCAPWRDRVALFDGLVLLVGALGVVLVTLMPTIIDRFGDRPALLVAAIAGTVLVAAGVACAFLIVPRADPRTRPDAWLLALAFLAGSLINIPIQLERHGVTALPGDWYAVVLAMAAATMALAAYLRARRPQTSLPPDPRFARAVGVITTLLVMGILVSLIFVDTPSRIAGVVMLVLAAFVRIAQIRALRVEAKRLEQVADRSQAARDAQARASLAALSTALEARDGYTGAHGEHTVALVRAVGHRLGLNPVEQAEVESVALLHDIGKIGTPDSILHKPGPLDDHERAVMRAHPVVGEHIVSAVPGLERVAHAVRHEHEHWDGSGYPDGLGGEAIPLASRIVLVCDAYHAMTSDRPYRDALAPEAAQKELQRCSGRQFDPAVVSALLAVLTTPPRTGPEAPSGQPGAASGPGPGASPPGPHTRPAALR